MRISHFKSLFMLYTFLKNFVIMMQWLEKCVSKIFWIVTEKKGMFTLPIKLITNFSTSINFLTSFLLLFFHSLSLNLNLSLSLFLSISLSLSLVYSKLTFKTSKTWLMYQPFNQTQHGVHIFCASWKLAWDVRTF